MRLNALRDHKETVMELCKDPEFRINLFAEAIDCYQEGEPKVGKLLLLDYLAYEQKDKHTGMSILRQKTV